MKEYANPNLARSRSCAGAVDHVCQPSGFVPGAPGEAMYGPILRTCTAMPAAAGGAATAVPTRAPGDACYQQHHDDADVVADVSSRLSWTT